MLKKQYFCAHPFLAPVDMNRCSSAWSAFSWVPSLYFVEGVPYFLVTSVSVTLFAQLGIPNGQMALFTSLITFPWVLKPLWSGFVDVVRTKRWWVLSMQFLMALSTLAVSLCVYLGSFYWALFFFSLTAFASATHDIAADGYYMLCLDEQQQSAYVGLRSTFYKLANIFCQSLLLLIAGALQSKMTVAFSWTIVLTGCSLLLCALSCYHAFFMPRCETAITPSMDAKAQSPRAIFSAIVDTFVLFFKKKGILLALLFMLLYRLPEALLLKLCNPFFLAPVCEGGLGMDVTFVGEVYGFGVVLMLLGGIVGGLLVSRYGLKRMFLPLALWLTLPCGVYVYLAMAQPSSFWLIALLIGIEQLGYGLGYTICMVYMMRFANGAYRTAHFSLCTAFMFLGLLLPGMVAGYLEQSLGYLGFFYLVMLCCVPSLLVAYAVYRRLD